MNASLLTFKGKQWHVEVTETTTDQRAVELRKEKLNGLLYYW